MNKITSSRRNVISGGIAAVALAQRLTLVRALGQSAAADADGPFTVPPLPYPAGALVPFISAETMMLHHGRHHAAYVSNLNALARDYPQIGRAPPHELLENIGELPEAIRTGVRNNLGGHANHTMFWTVMKPSWTVTKPGGDEPSGEVAAAIDRDLGGLDAMKRNFDGAGGKVFGSGWVFATTTRDGRLAIETRPNQDSPLMDGKRVLFGNDVWEHAYYLDYRNRRGDYLKAWWNVVNWTEIGSRYAAARAGTLTL
jgi:Fe-Mn family superoxide dismutase